MSDQDDQSRPLSDNNAQSQQGTRQQQGGNERGGAGHRHGRRRSGNQMHSPNESRRQEGSINASVNMTELRDLVELIATHGFTDFELEREGFRVRLRREQPTASSPAQSATQPITPLSNQTPVMPPPSPIQTAPPVSQPTPASSTPASATVSETAASSDADLHMITSPIVGTFYRSPSPTAEQFVRVGSTVEPDTVVCIVEAMKLMNEILAETSGTIEKIYVENAQPVEYGQPLFGVRK